MNPSDEELVTSANDGDLGSFRLLYERHYRMAVALANSRLHDVHLAEDAAQEAFVTARCHLSTLRDRRRFPQWLGTIVRRIAISMMGTRKDCLPLNAEAASIEPANFSDDRLEVRKAISRLSESQREVVYLRYFSNLSYEEIATTLDTTPQGVHGRLQRARKSLEKQLRKLTNR